MRSPVARTLVVFFVTGGVFASWGARIPAVKEGLGLSAGPRAPGVLRVEGGARPGRKGGPRAVGGPARAGDPRDRGRRRARPAARRRARDAPREPHEPAPR